MNSKVNVISDSEHELEVSVKYEDIQTDIDAAYREERKKISVPGFRKGKVPINMLKKLYGDAIEYQASEKIANKKFWEVVESDGLKPISAPQLVDINFVKGEDLSFKVKYEVMPELEVKDYTGQEIEKPVFTVRDEDVDAEIKNLLKSAATFEEAKKASDEDHRLTVNLQRLDNDGNAIENNTSENIVLDLTDPKVNPEIVKNALNKKVGDTFTFDFTDEHMHGEEKHVEQYHYSADVTKIEKLILPEVTEELLKKFSAKGAKNMDDLKSEFRESFENYYKNQSESMYSNSLLNKVVENNPVEVPAGYKQTVLERLVAAEIENAKKNNQPEPNKEQLVKLLDERAEWNAKWQIIMDSLAKKESLTIEDSDLEKLAAEEAEKTGISVDKLVKFYKDSNRKDSLIEEKVISFLKENNTVVEIDPMKKEAAKAKKAPAKKTAAKKTTTKKATAKKDADKAETKKTPAKKTTAKKAAAKKDETEKPKKTTTAKKAGFDKKESKDKK